MDRGFGAPGLVANVGVQVMPALRLEASHSRAAWMREGAADLPAGSDFADYQQRIWGAEAVFALGRTKLRGEAFHDTWQVPNVPGEPRDISWYLEGEQGLPGGVSLAARYGRIHFLSLDPGPGAPAYGPGDAGRWDYGVSRLQLGAAYLLARNAGLRADVALNRTAGPHRVRNDLAAIQLWWEF
jgi:hypothetical protein